MQNCNKNQIAIQSYPLGLPSLLDDQATACLTPLLQALDHLDHVVYLEAETSEVKIGIGQLFKTEGFKDFDAFEVEQLNRISLRGPKPFSVTLVPYDYARALVLGISPVVPLRTIVPQILLTYNLATKVLRADAYLLHADPTDADSPDSPDSHVSTVSTVSTAEQLATLQEQCTQLLTNTFPFAPPSTSTHSSSPAPASAATIIHPPLHFTPTASPAQYGSAFASAKDALHRGDVFQLVLSNTLVAKGQVDTAALCAYLIEEGASPFVVKFKYGNMTAVSATPERLVRKKGTTLETVPIAGTRPILRDGLDPQRATDLLNDPKERAEHLMLVDLGRNDLGRVSVPGTVNVKDYATVKYLSRVMHLVSTVQSEEARGVRYLDALRATLPAGTVSGAPKKKAMDLIDRLEVDERGLYAGCFLIEDLKGNYDSLITIRTLIQEDDRITLRVGSGIVLESTLDGESDELVNKALGQLSAIQAIYPGGVTYDFDPR